VRTDDEDPASTLVEVPTILVISAVLAVRAHATESMLPPGFLGDWCVTRSDERNTPPPWSYIAYRAEVVGPCKKNSLRIRGTTIRQGRDDCKIVDNLRTMLHTQLIRYTCRNGKKGFVQIVSEGGHRTETGLDMLFIDYAVNEAYWNEQEKELRP
jgi:hypothetical protein